MPIYAYRCENCGHAKDVLQKISDPVLTVCPACGHETFRKQLTSAGFQLKGSGWYVTDFKGGKPAGKTAEAAGEDNGKGSDAKSSDAKDGDTKSSESGAPGSTEAPKPAVTDGAAVKSTPAAAPAAASAPAPGPTPSGTGSAGGRQP